MGMVWEADMGNWGPTKKGFTQYGMEIPSMLEDNLMEIPQCEDISFDQQFVVFTNVLNNLWYSPTFGDLNALTLFMLFLSNSICSPK